MELVDCVVVVVVVVMLGGEDCDDVAGVGLAGCEGQRVSAAAKGGGGDVVLELSELLSVCADAEAVAVDMNLVRADDTF